MNRVTCALFLLILPLSVIAESAGPHQEELTSQEESHCIQLTEWAGDALDGKISSYPLHMAIRDINAMDKPELEKKYRRELVMEFEKLDLPTEFETQAERKKFVTVSLNEFYMGCRGSFETKRKANK